MVSVIMKYGFMKRKHFHEKRQTAEKQHYFADLVLFAILCLTAAYGTATAAGQAVVSAGILLAAAAFEILCWLSLDWAERAEKNAPAKPGKWAGKSRLKPATA